jgi:hypothetical protein
VKIKVEKLDCTDEFRSWNVWESEISDFDWKYKAEVASEAQTVIIEKGDYVVFPKGLSCRWKVLSPIKKYYSFEELVS